jgi:O-methyltransferase
VIAAVRARLGRPRASADTRGDDLLARIAPYAVGGRDVLERVDRLAADAAARAVEGDFVECGVCNGGSAAVIARALSAQERHAWLYDSFAGMPPTDDVDGSYAAEWVGDYVGSPDRVREAMTLAGVPAERFTIREGLFEDTFREELPDRVAFLHVDADWYASVKLALETFYDRVTDGGIILLDDFGHWEGCREAFYDFVGERDVKPLLERLGHTQAFWIKGRTHNRDVERRWVGVALGDS